MSLSTIIASEIAEARAGNATKLRDLDAFEEFFWLLEQSAPVFHAAIVEVTGATTVRQWKTALNAIQDRYPLLSASIQKIPGQRPFFEKVRGASMDLRIALLPDSLVLEEEMANEFQKTFGDGNGPLTWATLFHAPDRSVVMFATHHSSLDEKSHLLLIQDLLAAVAGENLGRPLEVQPGLAQLVGLPDPAPYVKTLGGRSVAPEETTLSTMSKIRVQRVRLSLMETQALQARARAEGTTVHGALVAAMTLAGKRYSDEWNAGPVRCQSTIDMRRTLGIPDVPGFLISAHKTPVLTPEGASFWDIARSVKEDILPAQSIEAAHHLAGVVSSMVSAEREAQDLYSSILNGPLAYELLITNYAGYRVRLKYGDLRIENLFTAGPSSSPTVQKVSVLTVNGRLGMTLVARDMFPTLLEDVREILAGV